MPEENSKERKAKDGWDKLQVIGALLTPIYFYTDCLFRGKSPTPQSRKETWR